MTLQVRLKENSRQYNANRDLAYLFRTLVSESVRRLEQGWPTALDAVRRAGDDPKLLGPAVDSLVRFVLSVNDSPKETMAECLDRSGWFDLPGSIQLAVLGTLGVTTLGAAFHAYKEATLNGVGPLADAQTLRWEARRCAKLMQMGRVRRLFYRLSRPLRRLWRRIRGIGS